MIYEWRRYGKIFDPTTMGNETWMTTHAQCPTPLILDAATLRVFFATRPMKEASGLSTSRPGYVDFDLKNLTSIRKVSSNPVLELGGRGTFDEFGVMPSCTVKHDGKVYLYYTGWTRMGSVPYTTAIGVAESVDGGNTFRRLGAGPLLGQSLNQPILVNSPIVKIIGDVWHMWYVSGTRWIHTDGNFEIEFRHAHATSSDGLNWKFRKSNITPSVLENECQDQLCPIKIGDRWHTFFSVRNALGFRKEKDKSYRLAHATSHDLLHWDRGSDDACLGRPETGWDSEMICSTHLLELDGRIFMFYCGNDFGRQGFGLAELLVH